MAGEEDPLRVTTVFTDRPVHPPESRRDVTDGAGTPSVGELGEVGDDDAET